jgi:aminoglycoside N3'-acetyltransferase
MNSPYFRLISVGGKIILLGVTPEYMTNFHTIEDVVQNFPEQVYLTRKLDFEVVNEDGNTIHIETYCHCPAAGDKRQCMKMVPYLERYGVIKRARLGHAEVIVVDARGLHEALLDLFSKGVTMYNPKPT